MPLLLGKKEPKPIEGLATLEHYAALPPPPEFVPQVRLPWGVLGNDDWSDCIWAGSAHQCMVAAALTTESEQVWDPNAVVQAYCTQTGTSSPPGEGGIVSDWFTAWRASDFCGRTLSAFAPVALHDHDTLKNAINIFGSVGIGLQLPQSAMDQFNAKQAWIPVPGSPNVGGHYVEAHAYDAAYAYGVSWGEPIIMSWVFLDAYMDEAWALVLGEFVEHHGDGRGVDIAAMQADLPALSS